MVAEHQNKVLATATNPLAYGAAAVVGFLLNDLYVGWSMIFLTVASGGYHWTGKWEWQKADEIAMYVVFFMVLRYILAPESLYIAIISMLAAALMGFTHKRWDTYQSVPILFFVTWIAYSADIETNILSSMIVLLVFLAGVYAGQKAETNEHIYDKYHAMWHILTGVGFILILLL